MGDLSNLLNDLEGFQSLFYDMKQNIVRESTNRDAFGRFRMSAPFTIFDSKHLYSKKDGTTGQRVWEYTETAGGTATFNGKTNFLIGEFKEVETYAVDQTVFFEVVQYYNPSTVTGDFTDVDTNISGFEKSTNISVISGGQEHRLAVQYRPAASGGKVFSSSGSYAGQSVIRDEGHFISIEIDGSVENYFVVFATAIGGTAQAACELTWEEIE